MNVSTISKSATQSRVAAIPAVIFCMLLGVTVIYGAGLSQADALHAAAHDGRHAFAFPCH